MNIKKFLIFYLVWMIPLTAKSLELYPSKKMSAEELEHKKPGTYITGIPQFGSDPLKGQGLGVDLFFFDNGEAKDPLFEYTPFKRLFEFHGFATNNDEKEFEFGVDMPYFAGTAWRFRADISYLDNPNQLYFGHGKGTMAAFTSAELRWNLGEAHFGEQHLQFLITPFLDAGSV